MPFRQKKHQGGDLCAIFVHAGAGFHSFAHETHHLAAVTDAAKVGMAILKNGGEATDAVECCLRVLEDREIANAGYGSNLTIDGRVECDATVVDYLGRSGAVAAAYQIKNPVALARIVLQESCKPLSLGRVPPNLLVGEGALDFAEQYGYPIVPNDWMVSADARKKWAGWREDLAAAKRQEEMTAQTIDEFKPSVSPGQIGQSRGHRNMSPPRSPPDLLGDAPPQPSHSTQKRPLEVSTADVPTLSTFRHEHAPYPPLGPEQFMYSGGTQSAVDPDLEDLMSAQKRPKVTSTHDGTDPRSEMTDEPPTGSSGHANEACEDDITDTVGAIAIDAWGRIAAGSSSGGISMKHKGRCGPAALVGIGTAVIPADPCDPNEVSVATCCSGTGEHMSTTTAAHTAADRILHSVKNENNQLKACDEDEALISWIEHDFMNHPGVKFSQCPGAIGLLAVKKQKDGIYFYYAHNTGSFALASMHSEERKPVCTMSRSKGSGQVASGGRAAHSKYEKR